jgi:hypothetical protein
MEAIKTATSNNNINIITEANNTNNSTIQHHGRNIQILTDDCIILILLQVDALKDLQHCKLINKRFLRIVTDSTELRDHLFFLKNCITPEMFLALPKNYILSINKQLSSTTPTITANSKNLVTNQQQIAFKKKLFSRIEHNLSQATEITLKNIITINHQWHINNTIFSKSRNLFATASNDGTAQIYQFINGSWKFFCSISHGEKVKQIMFSPDSNFIIITSDSKHRIWGIFEYECIKIINNPYSSSIIFRDDSKRFFFTGEGLDKIKVFDFIDHNWQEVLTIEENKSLNNYFNIRQGSFIDHPQIPQNIKEDKWLAFVIKRYTMAPIYNPLCNFGDKKLAFEVKNILYNDGRWNIKESYYEGIQYIDYSNDMKLIYVCTNKSLILEYINNEWQLKFNFPYKIYQSLGFSYDNQRLISYYHFREKYLDTITVWNIANNEPYKEIVLNNTSMAQFSKDGKYIITADENRQATICIWYFVDGVWRIKSSIKYNDYVFHVIFSNYNWMIAILSNCEATISELINTSETTIANNALTTDNNIILNEIINLTQAKNIVFSSTNNYFATFGYKLATIWRITTDGCESLATLKHKYNIANVLFTHDNSHIIISSASHTSIWGIAINKYSKELTIKTKKQPHIEIKDDSSKILIAEANRPIQILTLINNNWQQNFIINQIADAFEIEQGKFTPTTLLQQNDNDTWVHLALQRYSIVETAKQNKIHDFIYTEYHRAYQNFGMPNLNIVSFSQDKKLMYLGFEKLDCVILKNDNNQWSKKATFYGGTAQANFSSDNQRIVTISNEKSTNKRMIVWNIASDNIYQELGLNNINSAQFSQNNNYLVTLSSINNIVKIWSFIDDHWQVQHSITTDANPSYIKLSKDSTLLTIAYKNNTVKIYQLLEELFTN